MDSYIKIRADFGLWVLVAIPLLLISCGTMESDVPSIKSTLLRDIILVIEDVEYAEYTMPSADSEDFIYHYYKRDLSRYSSMIQRMEKLIHASNESNEYATNILYLCQVQERTIQYLIQEAELNGYNIDEDNYYLQQALVNESSLEKTVNLCKLLMGS